MKRRIIQINQDKCNGCGLCAEACHEGAIVMINGKAQLLRDDYCDGLGDCLPVCPTGAISFIEKDTLAYDEEAVLQNKIKKEQAPLPCGCPGHQSRELKREAPQQQAIINQESELLQWPVQIKLVPVQAPYFQDANLLIAADCTAYAYANFHQQFMKNKITLIGCPKLDMNDYGEKLKEIIAHNDVKSLTIVRMEVPCCAGIEQMAIKALKESGKFIPWQVVIISVDGQIL